MTVIKRRNCKNTFIAFSHVKSFLPSLHYVRKWYGTDDIKIWHAKIH